MQGLLNTHIVEQRHLRKIGLLKTRNVRKGCGNHRESGLCSNVTVVRIAVMHCMIEDRIVAELGGWKCSTAFKDRTLELCRTYRFCSINLSGIENYRENKFSRSRVQSTNLTTTSNSKDLTFHPKSQAGFRNFVSENDASSLKMAFSKLTSCVNATLKNVSCSKIDCVKMTNSEGPVMTRSKRP